MAFNAMAGFAIQVLVLDDFSPTIASWWLAAIPVVVIGAPLGAIICSYMPRAVIAYMLISLIAIELLTTLWLVPLSLGFFLVATGVFLTFSYFNFRMFNIHRYEFCDPGSPADLARGEDLTDCSDVATCKQ